MKEFVIFFTKVSWECHVYACCARIEQIDDVDLMIWHKTAMRIYSLTILKSFANKISRVENQIRNSSSGRHLAKSVRNRIKNQVFSLTLRNLSQIACIPLAVDYNRRWYRGCFTVVSNAGDACELGTGFPKARIVR